MFRSNTKTIIAGEITQLTVFGDYNQNPVNYAATLHDRTNAASNQKATFSTCALAAFHRSKPARRSMAKSPISCGISCSNIANVVIKPV